MVFDTLRFTVICRRLAPKIARNDGVAGLRVRIEQAEARRDGAGIARLRERRAVGEERVAVVVAPGRDVEWPAGRDRRWRD